jgi:hypothetical protein
MKRAFIAITVILSIALLFTACPKAPEPTTTTTDEKPSAAFHIGVVTGTTAQSEDDYRGAEKLIQEYGKSSDGGIVTHITYPDDFMSQQETVISNIVALADDPLMKAVIVNQAIPGTTEAFKRIREKNPNILLFAGEAHEDPLVIESAADVAINADYVARGYLIIWAAKELGAKTFVHISFPRHMSYETLGRRRAIMEEACKDLGLTFAFETAPDPTSEIGTPGAQQYIRDTVPAWIKKYGADAAFFCTNDAHTEPLLMMLLQEKAGIFVEADLPSPIMGYPGALGLDLKAEAGDFPKILKKVEAAIIEKGGAGRFGTWAYSYGYTNTAGLGEFAIRIINGKAKKDSLTDLLDAYGKYTPGAKWNGSNNIDMATGIKAPNHFLLYQDTYVFGKGYLPSTAQKVPEKYFSITANN